MTDTERITFLDSLGGHFSATEVRNLHSLDSGTEAYLKGSRVQLFTIPSQHVYGRDLRHAIDTAIYTAALRKENV